MTAQEVLVELTNIARANMADFIRVFYNCGDPGAAVDRLTSAQTAALGEMTIDEFVDGAGDNACKLRRIRFKLIAKIPALELLGKHHRLYVQRHEHDWSVGLADRLAAALARVDGDCEPAQQENQPEQAISPRPSDRRRRSPRAMRTPSARERR